MGFIGRLALIPMAGMVAFGCGSAAATTHPNAIQQARPATAPGTCCRGGRLRRREKSGHLGRRPGRPQGRVGRRADGRPSGGEVAEVGVASGRLIPQPPNPTTWAGDRLIGGGHRAIHGDGPADDVVEAEKGVPPGQGRPKPITRTDVRCVGHTYMV